MKNHRRARYFYEGGLRIRPVLPLMSNVHLFRQYRRQLQVDDAKAKAKESKDKCVKAAVKACNSGTTSQKRKSDVGRPA